MHNHCSSVTRIQVLTYGVFGSERYHVYAEMNATMDKPPLTMTIRLYRMEIVVRVMMNMIIIGCYRSSCLHTRAMVSHGR